MEIVLDEGVSIENCHHGLILRDSRTPTDGGHKHLPVQVNILCLTRETALAFKQQVDQMVDAFES